MTAPKYQSLRLDDRGQMVWTTTDELKKQRAAGQIIDLTQRFFQFRDSSHNSHDIVQDRDGERRLRAFSLTRDAIDGPRLHAANVQPLDGGFGDYSRPAAVDHFRFITEAGRLRELGVLDAKDSVDWTDDKSILSFFGSINERVHDKHFAAKRSMIVDAAPSIYVFTELLRQTSVLIEEDLTELWARRIFSVNNLNTWLPQWSYKRWARKGNMPNYVDIDFSPSSAPRQGERVQPVVRPLVFFDNAASWNILELERHAEAVANGAADISLDAERIATARRMMLWKEDCLAFFGDPEVGINGLFSPEANTKIERIPAPALFGAGDTEDDRSLLVNGPQQIILQTEDRLQPNTIMLSTISWLYVTGKRYGDVTADSNQTVAEAALATLSQWGIREIMHVPEVGYREAQETRLLEHGVPAPEAERLAGGLDGEQCMVVGRRDRETAELIVAKDLVMYPAQQTVHNNVEVRMLQGSGGMEFYKPAAWKIYTNVGPATL